MTQPKLKMVAAQDAPKDERKEAQNSLYWKTRCLRAEERGILLNVESLTLGLQLVGRIAKDALHGDQDEKTYALERILFHAHVALEAVWKSLPSDTTEED